MLLRDEFTERRLFGAIAWEAGALELCADVETDDFSDLHLKFAFVAIRNLQARGEFIDLESITRELERTGYVQVDVYRIADTAYEPPYNFESLLRHDAWWLRRLARRRGSL